MGQVHYLDSYHIRKVKTFTMLNSDQIKIDITPPNGMAIVQDAAHKWFMGMSISQLQVFIVWCNEKANEAGIILERFQTFQGPALNGCQHPEERRLANRQGQLICADCFDILK